MRLFLPVALLLPPLLSGCISSSEIFVDYPLESAVVDRLNRGGSAAVVERTDSTVLAVNSLRVDSVKAVWLADAWRITPLAEVRSITVNDPDDPENWRLKGVLYSAAAFGTIGLVDGLIAGRSGLIGETLGGIVAGGLLAAYAMPPLHFSRLKVTINPPATETARIRRESDRLRLMGEIPAAQADLQKEQRRYRIEPGLLLGSGNAIGAESDPPSRYALGGKMSFGYAFWERGEMGFEFSLVSHTFSRSNEQEQVTRSAFSLTGTIFPLDRFPLFVQGGCGWGFYSALATYGGTVRTDPPVDPPLVTGSGPAVLVGAGFDLRLSESWSIRPGVRYTFTSLGDVELNDHVILATGRSSHFLAFSLSLVFRGI